jgi:hypothetical protein
LSQLAQALLELADSRQSAPGTAAGALESLLLSQAVSAIQQDPTQSATDESTPLSCATQFARLRIRRELSMRAESASSSNGRSFHRPTSRVARFNGRPGLARRRATRWPPRLLRDPDDQGRGPEGSWTSRVAASSAPLLPHRVAPGQLRLEVFRGRV